jgi:diaminohydroxyphosphoribosylaminopyrimidine deaminase/5-amino-6-(5-phosphoribosylamino)uracil reductase
MKEKLPYVVLKTATTMDGKIATYTGDSKWITSEEARAEVYKMRKEFDCIMTSSNTVLADNPSMTHYCKCILDTNNRVPANSKIFAQGDVYVATRENTPLKDGKLDIKSVLKELYKKGIYTVFAECGGTLAGSMLREGLIDEIYHFIAPKILNDNTGQSCFNGNNINKISESEKLMSYYVKQIGPDMLVKYKVL